MCVKNLVSYLLPLVRVLGKKFGKKICSPSLFVMLAIQNMLEDCSADWLINSSEDLLLHSI